MRALVYHGPGTKSWDEVAKPTLQADTDAIIRVDATTICGTDLHILKGDVPAVTDGRIRDVTITTGLVDTSSTPTLLKLVASHQVQPARFVTHHFELDQFIEAYDVFAKAADTGALKVVLTRGAA